MKKKRVSNIYVTLECIVCKRKKVWPLDEIHTMPECEFCLVPMSMIDAKRRKKKEGA